MADPSMCIYHDDDNSFQVHWHPPDACPFLEARSMEVGLVPFKFGHLIMISRYRA